MARYRELKIFLISFSVTAAIAILIFGVTYADRGTRAIGGDSSEVLFHASVDENNLLSITLFDETIGIRLASKECVALSVKNVSRVIEFAVPVHMAARVALIRGFAPDTVAVLQSLAESDAVARVFASFSDRAGE